MNKIFKVVWSKTKNSYVVVSEIAKRNGKCSSSLNKKLIAAFLIAGTVLSAGGSAWAASYSAGGATANGRESVAVGAGSEINGSLLQGATASIYGPYNIIDSKTGVMYDGVANSVVGVGNLTNNANGALIWGAGNTIENAYGDVSKSTELQAAVRAYMQSQTEDNLKKAIDALSSAVAGSGGNVMAVGGANTAGSEGNVSYSQLMGVSNKLQSGNFNFLDGYNNTVKGDNNIAIGSDIIITANEAVVIGKEGKVESNNGDGSFVLGNNASATSAKSVALGSDSVADREAGGEVGYDVMEESAYSGTDKTSPTWTSTLGAVSVGVAKDAAGKQQTRQIINVAAGSKPTDAVNVAQLQLVASAVEDAKVHYFSVNDGGSPKNNYDNDGASETYAIAIGPDASASGSSSIAIGYGAQATGDGAIAIGEGSTGQLIASGSNSYVHGFSAQAAGPDATAWGILTVAGQDEADRNATWEMLNQMDHAGEPGEKDEFGIGATAWGQYNKAYGTDATAFGEGNIAYGIHSTAFGTENTTYGRASTAWGEFNEASGYDSTVFGQSNVASNAQATAFGVGTTASGEASTAFGVSTTASGFMAATAFGYGTTAEGSASTAFGMISTASGMASTAFGAYTNATKDYATAWGYGTNATNNYATAWGASNTASGQAATAFGNGTKASGNMATAFGSGSQATALNATAFGVKNTANAQAATAFGNLTTASGLMSTSFGQYTEASGKGATAFGLGTADEKVTASGEGATAFGSKTVAAGNYATAFGVNSKAYGENSLAALGGTVGKTANGEGKGSVAIGDGAEVLVDYAYAIGQNAKALEENTIAIGNNTEATGAGAVVFGNESKVSGENSIAIGKGHTVSGNNSGAFGDPDTVDGDYSYVVGNNSTVDSDANESFIMGNQSTTSAKRGLIFGNESKVSGEGGIVAGSKSEVSAKDSVAIGNNAKATMENSVALGSGSETTHMGGLDGKKEIEIPGTNTKYTNIKGESPVGTVSVGKPGEERTITNVAAGRIGPDSTDAVNGSELYAVEQKVAANSADIINLSNRVDKVGAGAAALAALHPMDFNPDDKLQFSAGVGNYRGETAAAVGAFYRPDESVMFSISGTFGNSDNMVNDGITFGLDGTRNRITRSRTAMAREIQDLRSLVTQMAARMDRLEGANTETAMFPDVPENHWAYEYVEDLQKRGALKGYPDGLFKGDRSMTRYEFAAMLDRLVRSGVTLDSKIAKEFEPELGRIYVERISGQDNDRKKVERVRVNNSDSKYPEGKTRDVYGSKIVTEIPKAAEVK